MNTKLSGIEHIGRRLRQARFEAHLTQYELGDLSGVDKSLIQKIENSSSHRPRQIMEIAEVLNVNPAWLQLGEPYARQHRPGEKLFEEPQPAPGDQFGDLLILADRLLIRSKKTQLEETAGCLP